MSLRNRFRSFLSYMGACGSGKRQAFGFTNLLMAWNRISDQNLSWFLAELASMDGITPKNATRLINMSVAIDCNGYDDGSSDYERTRRIYKTVRSRRNYNFVKTQFRVALRAKQRAEAENNE